MAIKDEAKEQQAVYQAALRRHSAVLERLVSRMADGVITDQDMRDEEDARTALNLARRELFDRMLMRLTSVRH
jgi:hypothetical protein